MVKKEHKITENDITGHMTTVDSHLNIQVGGKWVKVAPSESTTELTRALGFKWGFSFLLDSDNNIVDLTVDKYKNVDPELLEQIKKVRKDLGINIEE